MDSLERAPVKLLIHGFERTDQPTCPELAYSTQVQQHHRLRVAESVYRRLLTCPNDRHRPIWR